LIPYFPHPELDVGGYTVGVFPLFVGVAIVTQFQLVVRGAPAFGIAREQASTLLGWAIFLGIVGAHVFDVVVYTPEKLAENPLLLFAVWGTLSSFGGMLGGVSGLLVVMHRKGMSRGDMGRFVDCLFWALPVTLAIGRAGCALKHDHPGVESSHWLAVAYPGASRFDLGLLEFLYMVPFAALFLWLGRRARPTGFYVGLFFVLYGPARFALDALRISDVRYAGWTPGQYMSVVATLIGGALLAFALRRSPPSAAEAPASG